MDTVTRQGDNLLDRFLPSSDFGERHSTRVRADAVTVYRAIKEVTPREIALMRQLLWLRDLPAQLTGRGGTDIADPRPMLEQFADSGFVVLAENPPVELVFGAIEQSWRLTGATPSGVRTVEDFLAFDRPDFNRIVANLRIKENGAAVVLTTETRVHVPDPVARRKFGRYWRVIYPASWLLRVTWLRAIKRRAERDMVSRMEMVPRP